MKFVKNDNGQRVPIKSWCDPIEDGAMAQAIDLSRLPFLHRHVALMPDCHQGYGMPIGGVIACKDVIIPNAVGVDIGCGMVAVQTDALVSEIETAHVKKIMGLVRQSIPVGFKHHQDDQHWSGFDSAPDIPVVQQQLKSARKQLGTLGGGNHFIEIQKGDDGFVWLMLHSGSRNFGYKIAKEYNDRAVKECERWYSDIPNKDLAFLPIGSRDALEYISAMNYALDFALASRAYMMERFEEAAHKVLGCSIGDRTNIHHNFAALENHFGKNVWVHRKGATMARKGQTGIIPGSMGTPSYIVEGLGNPESFMSCSHGAGRSMGRAEASRNLLVEDCDKAMEGVIFGRWGKDRKGRIDLGEAPGAYKDIESVIEAELDLVRPVVKLWPLGVVKG
jgi:tRNA-splicing ligase RtcB